MKVVAQKEGYYNHKSVRSTIDKTIERVFYLSKDETVFQLLADYDGEKLTTKSFISSSVLYVRKMVRMVK